MKKLIVLFVLLVLSAWAFVPTVEAQTVNFYLIPIELDSIGNSRGPKYLNWGQFHPGIIVRWSGMDYGFVDTMLVLTKDISQEDHETLIANSDVFAFPDNLDAPVSDPNVDQFFEAINLPTDWLTPSTTYRELLRNVAGMMQFNQRYSGISAGHSIFENADLSTRLRQMTDEEQAWFLATVESFGIDPAIINLNSQLRLLVRQSASYWEDKPFYLGGVEF